MCVANEDDPGTGTYPSAGSGIEEIVVTAPRISLNEAAFDTIDWGEVLPQTLLGAAAGVASQTGWTGVVSGALVMAASSMESQEGFDLADLFEIEHDIPIVPGVPAPYLPLH